jgi:nucleotide-binding universal stress UspA family protein
MTGTRYRDPLAAVRSESARARPVLLATLDVPFASAAVAYAVDSAVELGQRLIVANFVERPPLPLSVMLGYDDLPYTAEMAEALNAPAVLARSLGIEVTRLRVKSFHPVQAMLEVIAEHDAGIVIFGPRPDRIGRLRYWRAARALRSRATSLVWLPD